MQPRALHRATPDSVCDRPWLRRTLEAALAVAAVALASCGSMDPPSGPAAGEAALNATSPTALLRSGRGDGLRMMVWYPAAGGSVEREIVIGDPGAPVFLAGRAAAAAPWQAGERRPLVLLSHGFGGAARQMTWLGTALARRGFVAAAVDHPGTNGLEPMTAEGVYAPWERAVDLRQALDHLLAHPVVGPRVDVRRVGVAGFSLGGWTALLLAGALPDFDRFRAFCGDPRRDATCLPQREYPIDFDLQPELLAQHHAAPLAAGASQSQRDPRIRSALLLAPALGQALEPASLRLIRMPVLVIAGDADPVTPTPTNGTFLAQHIPGARLELLPNVGHYDFLSPCGPAGLRNAAAYCTDDPGLDRATTHQRVIEQAHSFFARTLH